jgi:hypothetical protein
MTKEQKKNGDLGKEEKRRKKEREKGKDISCEMRVSSY